MAAAAAAATTSATIDTRVLGKGVKPFGADLMCFPWRSFMFVWMIYVWAVNHELREHMKTVEIAPAETPLSSLPADVARMSNTLAYMLSQVMEGGALVKIMNCEDGNGFEMWRVLTQLYAPALASHSVSSLRTVLSYRFRNSDWQHYIEDLETFELKITTWERASGDVLGDGIKQAITKEQVPDKIRAQIETTSFSTYAELKKTLVSLALTEISRREGGSVN